MSEKLNSVCVVTALKSLTQAETKLLMFHLGVPLNDLDDIEARRGVTCVKIYFVERWLEADIEASWEKLANGLITMEKRVLANSVRSNSPNFVPRTDLQKLEPKLGPILINHRTLAGAISEAMHAVLQRERQRERQENERRMHRIARYYCRKIMHELKFRIQTQNVEIQTLNIRTQCRVSYDELETFIWRIPLQSHHIITKSSPFYTGLRGYRMSMRTSIDPTRAHLPIFVAIMSSEHDDNLPWPFRQKVRFTLFNQRNRANSISKTLTPLPSSYSPSLQRPTGLENIPFGLKEFAPITVLEDKNFTSGNTIYFGCKIYFGPLSP